MRLQDDLARLADGIAALRNVYVLINRGKPMGKLSAIADRIKDTKTRLEAEADKLAVKLDGIDATAPKAFARGHAFIDAQAAEVAEIEDTLRQLSNLPLDESTASLGELQTIKPSDVGDVKSVLAGQGVPAKPTFPSAIDPGAAA